MKTPNLIHWNKALSLLNKFDYSHAIISENYGRLNNESYGTGLFKINLPAEHTDIIIHMCEITGRLYSVMITSANGYYSFVGEQTNKRRIRSFMQKLYNEMVEQHLSNKIYVTEGSRLHRFLNALSRFVMGDKNVRYEDTYDLLTELRYNIKVGKIKI